MLTMRYCSCSSGAAWAGVATAAIVASVAADARALRVSRFMVISLCRGLKARCVAALLRWRRSRYRTAIAPVDGDTKGTENARVRIGLLGEPRIEGNGRIP